MKLLIFWLLIGGGFLFSCDNTHERFTPPTIQINKGTVDEFTDSMKNVFKDRTLYNSYQFSLRTKYPGIGIRGFKSATDQGKGILQGYDNGLFYTDDIPLPEGQDSIRLNFQPDRGAGVYHLKFTGYNRYGLLGNEVGLTLCVFDNLLPEAKMVYAPDPQSGEHALTLDASASYDRDGPPRYNGKVATYDFTVVINGRNVFQRLHQPVFHCDFEDSGTYKTTLIVYDNEGASSKALTMEVTAP